MAPPSIRCLLPRLRPVLHGKADANPSGGRRGPRFPDLADDGRAYSSGMSVMISLMDMHVASHSFAR